MTSGLTATAASRIAWMSRTQSSSVLAVRAPIVPLVVSPMCGTSTSAPARAPAPARDTGWGRTVVEPPPRHPRAEALGCAEGRGPRQRPPARHAVAPRVVDDDQVGPAGFRALRR